MDDSLERARDDDAVRPGQDVTQVDGHKSLVPPSQWSAKYGDKHGWQRITDFPAGIVGPRHVRIYRRTAHYILQVWDPTAGRNISTRVDGDLVTAIFRAREIEERLTTSNSSGESRRRLGHQELVEAFVGDLVQRADAGEIDPRTVRRYQSALDHFMTFAGQPAISAAYPNVNRIDRQFTLQFAAFLDNLHVAPNGHPHASRRKLASSQYVADVARGMIGWAADPDRGNLLGSSFRNPFAGRRRGRQVGPDFLLGAPDITVAMAGDFLHACDSYQLPLFALLMLCGLRAAEPCLLFGEHIVDGWLNVPSIPQLDYLTKGRRDKRFPLVEPLASLLANSQGARHQGLLFLRRTVAEGRERPTLLHQPLDRVVAVFQERCQKRSASTATQRRADRDDVLRQAGALKYDKIEQEFRQVARQLNWPASATLKDFRHLFSTLMQNAGMPEFYRQFLMGHAPNRAAIASYTHLDDIRSHYEAAISRTFEPITAAIEGRAEQLGLLQRNSATAPPPAERQEPGA